MQVFWNMEEVQPQQDSVVTVGTFDGVHLGHKHIINDLQKRALKRNAISTLVTFEPHPQMIVGKSDNKPAIRILSTIEEKIDVLSEYGLERLIVVNFTNLFASTNAEQFVKTLVEKLGMKEIVIGYDHNFGKDRKGNLETLKELSNVYGFDVDSVKAVSTDSQIISSTTIRHLLNDGDVAKAATFLGRNYTIRGQVVKGDSRGKGLGFPTANIKPFSKYKLVPKNGIYASLLKLNDNTFNAITYVGTRSTFGLTEKVIETHVFDFNDDIYHDEVEINFIDFIRQDQKFDSKEELIEQIIKDNNIAQQILRH